MKGSLRSKLGPILVIVASLLILFWIFIAQAAVASPAGNEAVAWEATDNIKIDGDLSEWNTSSLILLENEGQLIRRAESGAGTWGGSSDLSANVYLMWDENNLYVGGEVTDDTPFMYRTAFSLDRDDGLSIYLSTNPEADPERTSYESTDFRAVLSIDNNYFDTGMDRRMVDNKCGIETEGMTGYYQVLDGYEVAVGGLEGGYVFEAKIPFSNFYNDRLPEFSPTRGTEIGFDLELNDLDSTCPGATTCSMAWTGDNSILKSPSQWGTLKFDSKAPKRPAYFVDDDSTVGLSDLMTVSYHYGESGTKGWIPADVDGSGSIGLQDLMTVAYHYGEVWEE